jgi:hypothetical protein
MKGASFADVAAIQERVTAVLRLIPKEALYKSWGVCEWQKKLDWKGLKPNDS